jgi:hypothetical protein
MTKKKIDKDRFKWKEGDVEWTTTPPEATQTEKLTMGLRESAKKKPS